MLEITAPHRPAFWQSQKLRQRYWHIASSTAVVLGRSTSVQLPARFTPSLHYTQLKQSHQYSQFGEDVVRVCEQVVGKVVTKVVQNFKLYKLGTGGLVYIAKCVFSVRRLLAVYTQDIVVYTHTKYRVYIDSVSFLYTLPTGPTNTNNLIKG